MPARRHLSRSFCLLCFLLAAACERTWVCPTIGCQPQVQLTYQQSISGPYHVAVAYRGAVYEADCPITASAPTNGIKSCDGSGLLLTGVDLGHGANDAVDLTVSIDSAPPIAVSAILQGILNSRDCDLVCFDHRGTVAH